MQQIGRYEILEEIGHGAMGVVFKGRDPLIGRSVAVKTITAGVAQNSDLLERFYREARAAGGLQHPNIVTIYEMAESHGDPFIAMEYLEGESLEKLIARRTPLSLAMKIGYIVQACRAFDYAHRRGVVHRDIKPANIMVTRDGIVKVVDFGIARIADTSKTQTGTILGTLAYMSPQQLRGQHADKGCDIWALGVVLYELITYQRPFASENHAALLLSILQDEPQSIRQLMPQCPVALERAVSRALRKDDKDRYPSMEALLVDLEPLCSSLERDSPAAASGETILPAIGQESRHPTAREYACAPSPSIQGRAHNPLESPVENVRTARLLSGQRQRGRLAPDSEAPSQNATMVATRLDVRPPAGSQPKHTIQPPNRSIAQPAPRPRRSSAIAYATVTILVLVALGALGYRKLSAVAPMPKIELKVTPPAVPVAATSATPSTPPLVTTSASVPAAAPSISASVENQQRHLIDLAHESADAHDYKAAQTRLDEAARLDGPLNGLIGELRRRFSEEAHGTELQRAARREQTLWDQATADMDSGRLDDAEKAFRDILTLPEGGHRWADAERSVDQVIPQRRQQDQLWAEAQLESSSAEPGHLLKEVKTLDQLLAEGGAHEQQARQMRDSVMAQFVRGNARKNRMAAPVIPENEQSQMAKLEDQFTDLVQKGDASALEQLQQLRPKFKALVDAGGPLTADARDYLNDLIPKTQKQIEDRLAAGEAQSSANAAYQAAVKDYDQAVATQNMSMLRGQVLPTFQQIAQSGNVRAKEADRYVNVLIPAALKDTAR